MVDAAELGNLDAAIERGLSDADTGRVKPAGEVFDRLEAKYRAMSAIDQRPKRVLRNAAFIRTGE